MTPNCRDCITAAWVLRRIGFRDNISWGFFRDSPNKDIIHGFHANSAFPHYYPAEYVTDAKGRRYLTEREAMRIGDDPLPLCSKYRSELAWLTAGRSTRLMIYMAHPVAGDFSRNKLNAERWLRYLRRLGVQALSELVGISYGTKPLVLCPWLAAMEPDGEYPGGRESAIADCKDTVMMFDEVWMVGGEVSNGMLDEAGVARVARDLTFLGRYPPDCPLSVIPASEKQAGGHHAVSCAKANDHSKDCDCHLASNGVRK